MSRFWIRTGQVAAVAAGSTLLVFGLPSAAAAPSFDSQGYLDSTARCSGSAVLFGSTDTSRVAICTSSGGGYEYRGVRVRDGAKLILTATQSGSGTFVAENDGITYTVSSNGLTVELGPDHDSHRVVGGLPRGPEVARRIDRRRPPRRPERPRRHRHRPPRRRRPRCRRRCPPRWVAAAARGYPPCMAAGGTRRVIRSTPARAALTAAPRRQVRSDGYGAHGAAWDIEIGHRPCQGRSRKGHRVRRRLKAGSAAIATEPPAPGIRRDGSGSG